MKIALMCSSLLLTKTLEIFLKKNISSYKRCDFVISDQKLELDKPQFVISDESSNLRSPFSQSSLMIELDRFYNSLCSSDSIENIQPNKEHIKYKISVLVDKFKDDLISIIDEK